ncbi:hypothetical protein ACQKNN_17490 [Bacillus paramycoides]|uniref:hypothetical protein n=1 Tax=Bacillus paramycoides TaxID=2026194 RepID=UPI00382274DB
MKQIKVLEVAKKMVLREKEKLQLAKEWLKTNHLIVKTSVVTSLCCVAGFAVLISSGILSNVGNIQEPTMVKRAFTENSAIYGTKVISAEAIDEYFAGIKEGNEFVGMGKLIYDSAVNDGIEPGVIAAEFAHFTDNGMSSAFQENNNPAYVMYEEQIGDGFNSPVNLELVIFDGILVSSKELSDEFKRFNKAYVGDIFKNQFKGDSDTTELIDTLNKLYAIQRKINEDNKN